MPNQLTTTCCVAGGGPAGLMLGYLLARAGVPVIVLEKHADFLRDFRGDIVHPSTLELIAELGLIDEFLKLSASESASPARQDWRRKRQHGGLLASAHPLQIPGAHAAMGFSQFPRRSRQTLFDI